jgi:acyl-coenzyme A synthetase/AMP-(fatty) acid ligase
VVRNSITSLWDSFTPEGAAGTELHGRDGTVRVADLATGSALAGAVESLRAASVLIATTEQLPAAVALLELDGVARRIALCTPDLTAQQLAGVAATAEADTVVLDGGPAKELPAALTRCVVLPRPVPAEIRRRTSETTEWILLTSGTTGTPKLVVHTLRSLAGTLPRETAPGTRTVWSTFYDIRRYGGLQIYLRAMLSGIPLVLSSPEESTRDFFTRAATAGVTHISGTPSHWRRALMSGDAARLSPEYVRLSGEVADQPLLDNLRAVYPQARIAHAFASTEAGVAFEVNDGLAGFPAEFIASGRGGIDLKVEDGTLRIRSSRNAARYLGAAQNRLVTDDGYVDTGDMVELVEGRYYFRGRKGGIINVGGLKVYPEEVESVLNADPRVRMSLVRARRNPITGAVVVADVVLAEPAVSAAADSAERVKTELLNACRRTLSAHKVPAMLRFVPTLELTAAGKLVRPNA